MKRAQPRGLSRRRIEQLLKKIRSNGSAGARIEAFSRHFVGSPYTINPLIGSAQTPEVFTVSLDGFDCVTYIETVLALARAVNANDFVEQLPNIRYEKGRIEWLRRNHYMTGWIRNNALKAVGASLRTVAKERTLSVVPGLPEKRTKFTCVPKSAMKQLLPQLKSGDLIFFASTRKHLDVFHCGIVIRDQDRILLRHASRSRNGVVEQDLSEFLKANRMAGVIVVRES